MQIAFVQTQSIKLIGLLPCELIIKPIMKKYSFYLLGTLLAAFGLLTFYLSGSVLFDLFEMRAKQGDYVNYVIWANFIASLLYFVAVYGFFTHKKVACKALLLALIVLVLGGIGLYFHIQSGGVYMNKTPKAIGFRFGVTLFFFGMAKYLIGKSYK